MIREVLYMYPDEFFLLNCKFHINEKKIVHTNLRLDPTWQKKEKQAGARNRRKWLIISAKET